MYRLEPTSYLWIRVTACLLLGQLPTRADTIPEIVAKAKPAVVEIVTIDQKGSPNRLGTGFFISPDGQVVTNQHVVESAASIAAINNNGAMFQFERVVAQPAGVDLAILKFRATDVPFLTLGKSTTAVEGQKVIVIGNPTGLTGTVSDGIISAFRENRSLIQITAPISPGSSGSPVMDENGEVIGVATLQSVDGQNLNFAIAVEKVSAALAKPESEQIAPARPKEPPTPAAIAEAFFNSGNASLEKKQYDRAISDFTEAIRLDPNYEGAYINRANAFSSKGNYDRAISDLNEAIRISADDSVAYFNRGWDYEELRNFDKAISDYSEAIRIEPDSGFACFAYLKRGDVYNHNADYDKAISDYTEAIRLGANGPYTYYVRGTSYYLQNTFNKAISDCSEAIRLNPSYADAYDQRGRAYLRTGNRAKANADFATAKRLKAGQ